VPRSNDAPLIVTHLSKRFGDVVALDGASLTVAPGRSSVSSANGAGKATMMR
jgi:ABC-type sugar transport system ATPase subunit